MAKSFSIEVAKDYFNFASAHFLIFANGQREALHGHNYQVSVVMEGELDRAGLVDPGRDLLELEQRHPLAVDGAREQTLPDLLWPDLIDVRERAHEVEVRYKKQKIILPRQDVILLPLANTSTELLAEHVADQIRKKVRRIFPQTKIRYLKVGVEEARGQRGFYRGEF